MDPSRKRAIRLTVALTAALLLASALVYTSFTAGRDELTASELSSRLAIGLTTVLHHLGLLVEAGLLSASHSRRKAYRLRRDGLARFERALTAWLE